MHLSSRAHKLWAPDGLFMGSCYHLLPRGSTPGEPRGNGTVLVFLFCPAGDWRCLVLKTTLLDHSDIHTGFVGVLVSCISLDQVFFAPFYFISMSNFYIMLWVFIRPPRDGLFVINFMSFTQRL